MDAHTMTVEEYTTPSPISVSPKEKLPMVWETMKSQGVRHVLVVTSGKVCGIVSERDLTTFSQADYFEDLEVQEVMSTDLVSVTPDTKLYEVALMMSEKKVGSAIVQDEASQESSLGIFTATDALNALVEVLRGDLQAT